MRRDGRLSVALHALLHMNEIGHVVTSEALAPMMGTNPVVVRRTMAGLRDAGIVRSEKGHGGGWCLARTIEEISIGDVYEALGEPAIFSIGVRDESPGCLVEQAVNRAIGGALEEAEALIMRRLHATTLAGLTQEFSQYFKNHHGPKRK